MKQTTKQVDIGMGRRKTVPSGEYICPYCVWKGDAGPGLQLKQIIARLNGANS
jgi:hypothetical protein